MKLFKRIAVFTSCAFAIYYFLSNTLVNLISVPLAAQHSYEAWKMSEKSTQEFTLDTIPEETETQKY